MVSFASGDRVVVALGAKGEATLTVAGVFPDGQAVRDAYTGRTATVAGGSAMALRRTRSSASVMRRPSAST